jgi:hypothetical protein
MDAVDKELSKEEMSRGARHTNAYAPPGNLSLHNYSCCQVHALEVLHLSFKFSQFGF